EDRLRQQGGLRPPQRTPGRTHVGPGPGDVPQAVPPAAGEALRPPAGRRLAARLPDRVLLLVVDDHVVFRVVAVRYRVAHRDPVLLEPWAYSAAGGVDDSWEALGA